jgi:3-oxoacyl-[acyl-carrier protein] reductase
MKLQNKRAIVTGGTRGIGKAIVLELACQGCNVVFTYQSSVEAAKILEKETKKYNVKVLGIQADASNMKEAEKTIKFILENLGGLDILVNNVGITRDNLLLRMSEEDFDKVISANLKSVFNYTKASLKPMLSQRYGRIINISSVVALIGNPGQANYVSSKAGIIGFTKSTARELGSRNITVNSVAPGYIQTEMTDKLTDQQKEAILTLVPLKRMGTVEDVAKVISFLASSEADYITGQVISVDGGMAM